MLSKPDNTNRGLTPIQAHTSTKLSIVKESLAAKFKFSTQTVNLKTIGEPGRGSPPPPPPAWFHL